MKRFRLTLEILICSIVFASVFFVFGCSENKGYSISTLPEMTIYSVQTDLPEIKINDQIHCWNEFSFENEDGYVYVYDGKICLTENYPDEFITTLNDKIR